MVASDVRPSCFLSVNNLSCPLHYRNQIPSNFNQISPPPSSSSSQMPPTAMGAKTSAPIQPSTNLATSASGQRVSMPQSQETVVATQQSIPQPQPPTSFASYSAVPFPTPTPSSSNAFVPPPPQQYSQPVMMQTQKYSQQQQQMAPPLSGPSYSTPVATVSSPMSYVDNTNGNMQVLPDERFQASPQPPQMEIVLTLYPFTKNQVEELSFNADEVLEVLDKPVDDPNWWRCRNSAGNVGLVPKNYIRVIRNTAPPVSHHHAPQSMAPSSIQPMSMSPSQPMLMIDPRAEEVRRSFLRGSPNAFRFANQPWYWGTISRSECESLLTNLGSDGEFFVRDSETHGRVLYFENKKEIPNWLINCIALSPVQRSLLLSYLHSCRAHFVPPPPWLKGQLNGLTESITNAKTEEMEKILRAVSKIQRVLPRLTSGLRLSPGDLTITMNAGSKNRNFKVHMKDGEFYIGLKVFTSLEALIENYRRHPIFKNEHEKHFLTQPFQHPECGAFLSAAFDKLLQS
ncbi:hypothetical protein ACTXT7_008703 [Hymenolepis weldensis]